MQEFTVRKGSFREIRKKLIVGLTILYLTIALLVYTVAIRPVERGGNDALLYMSIIMAAVLSFTGYYNVRRQRRIFESYRLTITEEEIIREQLRTPPIIIPKASVKEIVKASNGALVIRGDSPMNAIIVPAQLERREDLERLLEEMKPIMTKTRTPWLKKFLLPIAMLSVVLIFVGFVNDNKILSSISGLALAGLILWGFIIIQRSKQFDRRLKRISYLFLIPFLSILAGVILRWIAV
jgi:hypothetical protein